MPRPTNEGETAVDLVDPLVGSIFDKRFRIEERLAAGGFGAIYRAIHVKSGHAFALKVLHPTLASDLGVLARFRREGSALTSLRNPHTITAYEFGQADKILFIVLELLHGDSLYELYSVDGPMEWQRVAKIAIQVCESLEEAHALGIVHRDLKPTNIHLEEHDGDPDFVKVLDFGIAKILRGSSGLDSDDITNAGQMIGTLDYMSPEQMVGGEVTGQTDIYTLGIVMYEMIAGTRPFPESETAGAALAAMLKTTPEALYLRAPIPRSLDAVVMRCLERSTERRYRTVGELKADLEHVLADAATGTATRVSLEPDTRDDEETRVTPTPEPARLLDAQRTQPRSQPHTWDDDEDQQPTTSRRPEGARLGEGPPIRPTPRPLSRLPDAPVPRIVVAPFSDGRRAQGQAMSNSAIGEAPTIPALPIGAAPGDLTPTPTFVPTPPPRRGTGVIPTPPPAPPAPSPAPPGAPTPGPPVPPSLRSPSGPLAVPTTIPPSASGPVAAPFSTPASSPYPGAPVVAPPGVPSPSVSSPGLALLPPTPPLGGSPRVHTAAFDMGQLAARDAFVRRIVWIAVLVVAAGVGFVIATQL